MGKHQRGCGCLERHRRRVLHNRVDTQQFRPLDKAAARRFTGLPVERRIILYVGNLKEHKGVLDLLDATRQMMAAGDDVPLVVFVGDGSARPRLLDQVRRYALTEHVRFVGARPHAEAPDWMAAADVLCLPSHTEGCPNVVLEALACGLPVGASNVGAIPDLMEEGCGLLVPPGAPRRLAAALRAVVPPWAATAHRPRVKRLSWEANAAALAEELKHAVQARRMTLAREGGTLSSARVVTNRGRAGARQGVDCPPVSCDSQLWET